MRLSVLAAIVLTCYGCVAAPRTQDASSAHSVSGTLFQYEREHLKAGPPAVRQFTPSAAQAPTGTSGVELRQPEAGQTRSGGVEATSSGSVLAQYLSLVDRKIQSNWVPLESAAGPEAVVVVHLRVLRSGAVMSIEIEKSSGSTALDSSAVQAIQRSMPLPSFPNLITEPFLDLRYHFVMERETQ